MVDLSQYDQTVKLYDASKIYSKICDIPSDLKSFNLEIRASGIWYDWTTPSSVRGYQGGVFQPKSLLRVKPTKEDTNTNYFTLIGVIAPSDLDTTKYQKQIDRLSFPIGSGTSVRICDKIYKHIRNTKTLWESLTWSNQQLEQKYNTTNYSLYVFPNDVKYFYFNNNTKPANVDITFCAKRLL